MIIRIKLLFILVMASSLYAADWPPFVTVKHSGGIHMRESLSEGKGNTIGVVYDAYVYPVIEGKVTYVKVQLPSNEQGWVYVGGQTKKFEIKGNHLMTKGPYAVSVKSITAPYKAVGVIKPKEAVTIIDRWYGRLKVRTPDDKEGWIFNGPYHTPWTSSIGQGEFMGHYFADFSMPEMVSNVSVTVKAANFSTEQSALQLTMPEESEASALFSLDKIPDRAVLVLTHKAAALKDGTAIAPISVTVNGHLVIMGLTPSGVIFQSDLVHI